MRLIFAGSPEFSVPSLKALVAAGHEVCAVYTQPDRPAGRGRKLNANPVKQAALELKIPVLQPLSLKSADAQQALANLNADAMIVAAYGLLLPQAVLDEPKFGCINVHASLLPRWRGAAPIHRAIQAGDSQTGVTIMQMALGLDTGDMLAKVEWPISNSTTAASLHDELAVAGADLLIKVLDNLPRFQAEAEVQNDAESSYAKKLTKAESWLNWQQSAAALHRQIRAFNPWPGSQTLLSTAAKQNELIKIWAAEPSSSRGSDQAGQIVGLNDDAIEVACGDGCLRIIELQPAGKTRMAARDFARSRELGDGLFHTAAEQSPN